MQPFLSPVLLLAVAVKMMKAVVAVADDGVIAGEVVAVTEAADDVAVAAVEVGWACA